MNNLHQRQTVRKRAATQQHQTWQVAPPGNQSILNFIAPHHTDPAEISFFILQEQVQGDLYPGILLDTNSMVGIIMYKSSLVTEKKNNNLVCGLKQ